MREWLVEKRKAKHMSQNEVANLIGVDRSTVTAYELGIRTPTPKVAQKLAKVLKFKWTKFYS